MRTILNTIKRNAPVNSAPAPVTPAPVETLVLRTYETKFGKLAKNEQAKHDSIYGSRNNSR